jgi:hypothetical protein
MPLTVNPKFDIVRILCLVCCMESDLPPYIAISVTIYNNSNDNTSGSLDDDSGLLDDYPQGGHRIYVYGTNICLWTYETTRLELIQRAAKTRTVQQAWPGFRSQRI